MKIAIIGQGGHSKVIRDLIQSDGRMQIAGYFDDKYEEVSIQGSSFFGPVLSARKMLNYFDEIKFVVAIGNNKARKLIVEKLGLADEDYAILKHQSAMISPSAEIGHGTVIMPHSVINADTRIGCHAIINTSSVIEHDNKLGDFVHVSPSATLTGSVVIDEGVHIGAGAVIIPNIKIGEWSIIGAGATVINNIPSHCTAVGIPAKVRLIKIT